MGWHRQGSLERKLCLGEMHIFDRNDVQGSFDRVCSELGLNLDKKISDEYQNGLLPGLLAYEQLEQPGWPSTGPLAIHDHYPSIGNECIGYFLYDRVALGNVSKYPG